MNGYVKVITLASLSESIDTESEERESADNTLQDNITTLENKSFVIRGEINDDWSDLEHGIYLVTDDTNIPSEAVGGSEDNYYGYLFVLKNDITITEIFIPTTRTPVDTSDGTISLYTSEIKKPESLYIRHFDYMGAGYTDWIKFSSEDVIQSTIDAEIVTREEADTALRTDVTALQTTISDYVSKSFEVVEEVPTTDTAESGVFYMVLNSDTGNYDTYILTSSGVVSIGSSDIDLSGYMKTDDIEAISESEIDEIINEITT